MFAALCLALAVNGASPTPSPPAGALPGSGSAPMRVATPAESPAPGSAVITQTASTNRPGFAIEISPAGMATVRSGGATRSVQIAVPLAARLFDDLEHAGDLTALPAGACMKSASFGTTTVIAYRGAHSPDLQCAQNATERALQADVAAITAPALDGMPQLRRTLPVMRSTGAPN